ncbi:hypothetical protein N0V84_004867 [Fusarium piperis]|uniref:Zn(2)-C6 fungal-type domain-containing protein n=1 Tax=Fusarium piperis TaxID=1435070 RepID=A0A9W8WF19_9HYPO|nr:hypothetical protein N0V84_004867 [Fusarium piperis]
MERPQQVPKKKTRTRSGCLNCRRKKRKCDEGRPACGTCRRRSEHCEWGLKITFRAENAQVLDGRHPSMRKMARRRPREFEILDVTSEVIRDYNAPSSLLESEDDDADSRHMGGLPLNTDKRGIKCETDKLGALEQRFRKLSHSTYS